MNLCFSLSDECEAEAKRILDSEIEYCVPADLNIEGRMADGFFVVGRDRWVYLQDGKVLDYDDIANASEYTLRIMIGNAFLEAEVEGKTRMLVRVSMKHIARYAYIAKILNDKSAGRKIRIYNTDDEKICPKCGRPIYSANGECPSCVKKTKVLVKLLSIARAHVAMLLIAAVLLVLVSCISMLNPYIQKVLINACFTIPKGSSPNVRIFVLAIGALILTTAASSLLSILQSRIMAGVSAKIASELRELVFNKLQNLSVGFFSSRQAGDVINRITSDTERIRAGIMNFCGSLVQQLLTLVGVGILLFMINWKMALIIILPAPMVAYFQYYFWTTLLRRYTHRQWHIFDRANSFLHDVLSGIRVVKAFGREKKEVSQFVTYSKDFADASIKTEVIYSYLSPISNFIVQLGQYVIILLGCIMIMEDRLTVGGLIQFISYSTMIYGPLTWIMYLPRMLGNAAVGFERIFSIIDEKPEIENAKNAVRPAIRGEVTFENVTFGYKSYEPVLKDIDLKVRQGEMIGLVGHSGAGKSTLINLVMRFYDVNEGCIKIDGVDLRDIDQEYLRSQIGVVLQEPFLFNGTIMDNIRYSKPDATEEEVIMAAKIANAHDFIVSFPDGYDTWINENGNNLSGGEKQRISIARAVLNNPKILILDEATSALDTETESLIQEALKRVVKSRTTFAIAHRLATLRNADRLIVLDKGRIAEFGTHDELLRKRGIYYNLVMAQREMTKSRA